MTAYIIRSVWTVACRYDDIIPERGVAVLVEGVAVAVFRTYDGALYAISNLDPFSKASVLSRGIVGDRGGRPTVASPIYKQVFELATGICLDDPDVAVPTYPVRVVDEIVEVGPPR
ncbi:MAG: nitrite reductase small subunit NirD [Pseudonocardiaceae bacterium]